MLTKIMWNIVIETNAKKEKNFSYCCIHAQRVHCVYSNLLIAVEGGVFCLFLDKIKVHECFSSIPLQLAKDNKKFQYKVVKEGYNARYYDASLRWLSDSGLIMPVHRLKCIDFPLEIYKQLSIFKVYMFDTGLLISLFNEAVIAKIHTGELGIFKGAIYENIAAQIMYANHKAMYYFEPNTSSEIDFVTYCGTEITPIEIKSGVNTRSKSFDNFVKQYHSKIAYRFSEKNIGESNGVIRYLPIYLLPFIF